MLTKTAPHPKSYGFYTVISLNGDITGVDQISSFRRAEDACDPAHEIVIEVTYTGDTGMMSLDTWGPNPGQTFRLELSADETSADLLRCCRIFKEAFKAAVAEE